MLASNTFAAKTHLNPGSLASIYLVAMSIGLTAAILVHFSIPEQSLIHKTVDAYS